MSVHTVARETPAGSALTALRQHARPLGPDENLDPVLDAIGKARFALLGEASHGTHEFHSLRAAITRRLIVERGFNAIALEADWPDAHRVDRYVRGRSDDRTANEALSDFRRFPAWMWRNTVVVEFIDWLRRHNDAQPFERKVGFYGLDVYAMATSNAAVLDHLDRVDRPGARRARLRYACFDHFDNAGPASAYASAPGDSKACEDGVVKQLLELTRCARTGGASGRDRHPEGGVDVGGGEADGDPRVFGTEHNARLARNAEQYHRVMFRGRASAWNLRDRHMAETLDAIDRHLARTGTSRIAVWAHNAHVGDASATEMSESGEWNVGQLVRAAHGRDAALVGFTTYRGTVTAASYWGSPAQRLCLRAALPDSWEDLLHRVGSERFTMVLRDNPGLAKPLKPRRLQRGIGVVYMPATERLSHYLLAHLPRQFDALIHFDETRALEPLEPGAAWHAGEAPETCPAGL